MTQTKRISQEGFCLTPGWPRLVISKIKYGRFRPVGSNLLGESGEMKNQGAYFRTSSNTSPIFKINISSSPTSGILYQLAGCG